MQKQQTFEKSKLSKGEIRRHDGLHAFLSGNADTDVRGLNHPDVVGAVANG